jgi:hypothetical protein
MHLTTENMYQEKCRMPKERKGRKLYPVFLVCFLPGPFLNERRYAGKDNVLTGLAARP